MAQAQTIKFGEAYLLMQDPEDSGGAFIAPCGFENLTMTINIESNTTNVPDCSNPDFASWLQTDIVSQQMTFEGEGVLSKDAMERFQDWWYNNGSQERQVRFFRNLSSIEGGGYFQGLAVLTAYVETGQRGNRWRVSMTVTMNGKPTWTPVAP